jgi:hypothetical protein
VHHDEVIVVDLVEVADARHGSAGLVHVRPGAGEYRSGTGQVTQPRFGDVRPAAPMRLEGRSDSLGEQFDHYPPDIVPGCRV